MDTQLSARSRTRLLPTTSKKKVLATFLCVVAIATLIIIVLMKTSSLKPSWRPTWTPLESFMLESTVADGRDHNLLPKWALSGTTGSTFSGEIVRQFPRNRIKFHAFNPERTRSHSRSEPSCKKWAVMTTIFDVSDAVRRQVKLKNWCLVVVFDKRSAESYDAGWTKGEGNDAVVYLRPDDQVAMRNAVNFVSALPWNHFGRKNIGYLYAIMHGAEVI